MATGQGVRDVVIFVTLYVLLSLVPFLVLNREVLDDVEVVAEQDVVLLSTGGLVLLLAVSGLFLAREGVDRYNQFLFAPTDALSVLMELFFLLAAISWWLVPELVFYLEWDIPIEGLLAIIVACQLPMVMFLSLMTAIGKV